MKELSIDRDCIENINLSIQLNRWMLKFIGIWPIENEDSKIERYFNHFVNSVCYFLILLLLIPCSSYLMFEEKETYIKIRLSGPISFLVMGFVKYYILIEHGAKIQKCVEYIKLDWRTITHKNDRCIMIENAQFGRRLIVISSFFVFGSAFFYYIIIPINIGKVSVEDGENFTFIPLLYPVPRFFVDSRRSPVNEIMCLCETATGLIIHTISAGACGLTATLVMHVYGQLEVLMLWIEHLVDGREDFSVSVDHRINMIINHHVYIRSFIALMEEILQNVSLVEVAGCTLNMCLLGYYIIMEGSASKINHITYTVLLMSFVFNIFMLCYVGELLSEQCERIGDVAYMTDWYRLPGKTSLALILIIATAKSTRKLTAGNLIELSLASFSDVVKASVGYLNMLHAVTT